jgi:LmbE family N-acetylglucosaminyl deacetylase
VDQAVISYLFVVAHPDDEVLGAGGMMFDLAQAGHKVHVIVLNTVDTTRYVADASGLVDNLEKSDRILGVTSLKTGKYIDSEFHNASHRQMVIDIEDSIKETKPDFIFTHHPGDINTDHAWASFACQEAARAAQRGRGYDHRLKCLAYMEVQSSTDWHLNPAASPFTPNYFVEISSEGLDKKIEALSVYENVIRPAPHPRSEESLRALPVIRGSQGGFYLAEAFQVAFMTMGRSG